jgi:hypothetical protein
MIFRIGINLGDVVEESGRIYGDGVESDGNVEKLIPLWLEAGVNMVWPLKIGGPI